MRKIVLVLSALFLLTARPAAANNGLRMIGFSPIQSEMGGASVGLPLDSATAISNPAGLAELKGRVDFGTMFFGGDAKYSAAGLLETIQYPDKEFTSSTRNFQPLPAIGVVIPLSDRLNVGTGMFTLTGLAADWSENINDRTAQIFTLAFRIPFAAGFRVNDWLSLGASFNMSYQIFSYTVIQFNPALSLAHIQVQQPHMDATSLGLSGTVGVLVKPIEGLSIGLSYESPTLAQSMRYNVARDPLGSVVSSPLPSPEVDYVNLTPPMVATVGLGWVPIKGVALAADLEWINWEGVQGKNKPKVITSVGAQAFDQRWSNQWVVKVGTQLDVVPDKIKLRLGWDYGKNPADPARAIQNILVGTITEHHFTAGLTTQITPKLSSILGGMYAPTVTMTGSSPQPPPEGELIDHYTVKTAMYQIDAGLSYVF